MAEYNASRNNVTYATCCTYVEPVKSLKGVECDIENPVLPHLSWCIIISHARLLKRICLRLSHSYIEKGQSHFCDSFVLGDCAVIATSLTKSVRLHSPN